MAGKVITNQDVLNKLEVFLGAITATSIDFSVSIDKLINAKRWTWNIDEKSLQAGVCELLVKSGYNAIHSVSINEYCFDNEDSGENTGYDIVLRADSVISQQVLLENPKHV